MKLTKSSFALIAMAGLLMLGPSVRAQDNGTNAAPRRRGGAMNVDTQLERLTTQLSLTDEQKPKVKAVLENQNKEMQALQNVPQDERRTKGREIRDEMNKKMKEILTPEQYTKFE